jgi:hypothetical protein
MRITVLKSVIIFLLVLALIFSFPLQVIFFSPFPSLIPYVLIFLLIILTYFSKEKKSLMIWNFNKPIYLAITSYLTLVIFQTTWQTLTQYISINSSFSVLVTNILPVLFFFYFVRVGDKVQIKALLFALAISGIFVGLYFAFDSYSMLVVAKANDFSLRMIDYSQSRIGGGEVNEARISVGYRSHGLLESHTISAAAISVGCFASLSLVSKTSYFLRAFLIVLYGTFIVLGLNFTSIISYFLILFILELNVFSVLNGIISKMSIKSFFIIFLLFILTFFILIFTIGNEFFDVISKILDNQVELASGSTQYGSNNGDTYIVSLCTKFFMFPIKILESFPPGLIIGQGFGGWGALHTADFGIVDSLYTFGIVFFFIFLIGVIKLIKFSFTHPRFNLKDPFFLKFTSMTLLYFLFCESHYTVYNTKAFFPILFFCLALIQKQKDRLTNDY